MPATFIYTALHQGFFSTRGSTTMTTATKNFSQSGNTGIGAKLAQLAYAVAATVLMLEMREALHAKTSSGKSDAAFKYGL
jgi:hypothetical protein